MGKRKLHTIIDGIEYKECSRCKKLLTLDNYHKDPSKWDGLRGFCKECTKDVNHKTYEKNLDCVASTGNALAYVSNEDVLMTLERMDAHVRPGGYLCFDSRNWEKIQREKQRFYLYNPFFHNGTRVNLVQVWDHNPNGSITFNLLYTFEQIRDTF